MRSVLTIGSLAVTGALLLSSCVSDRVDAGLVPGNVYVAPLYRCVDGEPTAARIGEARFTQYVERRSLDASRDRSSPGAVATRPVVMNVLKMELSCSLLGLDHDLHAVYLLDGNDHWSPPPGRNDQEHRSDGYRDPVHFHAGDLDDVRGEGFGKKTTFGRNLGSWVTAGIQDGIEGKTIHIDARADYYAKSQRTALASGTIRRLGNRVGDPRGDLFDYPECLKYGPTGRGTVFGTTYTVQLYLCTKDGRMTPDRIGVAQFVEEGTDSAAAGYQATDFNLTCSVRGLGIGKHAIYIVNPGTGLHWEPIGPKHDPSGYLHPDLYHAGDLGDDEVTSIVTQEFRRKLKSYVTFGIQGDLRGMELVIDRNPEALAGLRPDPYARGVIQ